MSDNILAEYKAPYKRISDGRDFLCRNITANDCKMYDTVDKTFEAMSTTKRSKYYKRAEKSKYHQADKKKPRVSGAKVRDLRKAGHEIIGGVGDWE